jgi:hypothetical protein
MKSVVVSRRTGKLLALVCDGILLLSLGCGGSTAELERARQAEEDTAKQLRECQEQLEETRKALEAARKAASKARGPEVEATESWKAARMTAEVFLAAVNSRDADAANAAGTKQFQEKHGGKNAIDVFTNGRFRGDPKGYRCELLTRLEPVPGKDEFVGRGGLQYRGVAKHDSTYTIHIVKEGEKWRVSSFTAVER